MKMWMGLFFALCIGQQSFAGGESFGLTDDATASPSSGVWTKFGLYESREKPLEEGNSQEIDLFELDLKNPQEKLVFDVYINALPFKPRKKRKRIKQKQKTFNGKENNRPMHQTGPLNRLGFCEPFEKKEVFSPVWQNPSSQRFHKFEKTSSTQVIDDSQRYLRVHPIQDASSFSMAPQFSVSSAPQMAYPQRISIRQPIQFVSSYPQPPVTWAHQVNPQVVSAQFVAPIEARQMVICMCPVCQGGQHFYVQPMGVRQVLSSVQPMQPMGVRQVLSSVQPMQPQHLYPSSSYYSSQAYF